MSILNADVLHILSNELLQMEGGGAPSSLLSLSAASRLLRHACLPIIFSQVRWPHKSKVDAERRLLFFPESLQTYIRSEAVISTRAAYLIRDLLPGISSSYGMTSGQNPVVCATVSLIAITCTRRATTASTSSPLPSSLCPS